MPFSLQMDKKVCAYKTLYLPQDMVDSVDKIASENGLSFNRLVVNMIAQCLKDLETIHFE